MSASGPTGARTLRGGSCGKRRGQGHESRGVQGRGRNGPGWGCQPVPFLCRQSVIRAQATAQSPRALLLQSQHRTRVPTPFISPASPMGEASVHSCSPDPASDTPSVNLPTWPCAGQAVLGGFKKKKNIVGKKGIKGHGGYVAYSSSYSPQRVKLISRHNNQTIFSFRLFEIPML